MKVRHGTRVCVVAFTIALGMTLIPALQSYRSIPVGGSQAAAIVFPTTVAMTGVVTAYTPPTNSVAGSLTVGGVTVPLVPGFVVPSYVAVGACVYIVYIVGTPNNLVEVSPGFHCQAAPTSTPVPIYRRQPPTATPMPALVVLKLTKLVRDFTLYGQFASSAYAAPGDEVRYRLTVTNTGTALAQNVQIVDPIAGYQSDANKTVHCGLGNLAPGQSQSVVIKENVLGTAFNGQQIYNTATALADNANRITSGTVIEVSGAARLTSLRRLHTMGRSIVSPASRSAQSSVVSAGVSCSIM